MDDHQRYRAGMTAYNAGAYIEAIEHLTPLAAGRRGAQALLSRFYLGQAHYHLAIELFEKQRFSDAAAHFQVAAQANPAGGGFARFLAVCYVGMGRFDLAAQELDTVLRANPDDAGARIRLALTQWRRGQVLDAISLLREGLRRQGDHAELHYQLGVMLAAEDELAEAQKLFEKTIALDPSHAGAYEKLAQCCSVAGRHERALRYLERAHQLDPANARIALQLAIAAPSVVDPELANRVRWRPPTSTPGEAMDDNAIERLGDVIAAEPDFIEAFLALPPSEVDQEVFSILAATLEQALRKHPEFADLHYHCSVVYRRLNQPGEAIKHAKLALEINPRYVQALILLAQLYGQTDRWAAGVQRLEQAIQAGVDDPDVHSLIGRLYQEGNRPDYARQAYQRALDLDHDHQAAREALARLPA